MYSIRITAGKGRLAGHCAPLPPQCNDDNCGVCTRDVCAEETPHAEDGVRKGHACPRLYCEGTMIREVSATQ